MEAVSAYPVVLPWTAGAPLDVPDLNAVRADTAARLRQFLEEARAELVHEDVPGGLGDVDVRRVVAGGPPAVVLTHRAEGADLLVVGNRGRSAVRSALLGSVALHCVTHARCPVLVLHGSPGSRGQRAEVVGFDGSAGALAALREGIAHASSLGTGVQVVVAHSLADHWADMYAIAPDEEAVRTRGRDEARRRVDQIVAKLAAAGAAVPVVEVELAEGSAKEILLQRSATPRRCSSAAEGTARYVACCSAPWPCTA